MTSVRLALLGGFGLAAAAGGELALTTRKDRLLLAYLALAAGRPLARDRLAGLLWGDRGETQARDSLRQSLAAIRQAFRQAGLDPLEADREQVAFRAEGTEIDVQAFERAAGGDAILTAAAADLYRGDLLEGMDGVTPDFTQWLLGERERLAALAALALERVSLTDPPPATLNAAEALARRLIACDPLRESAYRSLMRLLLRKGARSEALRAYASCSAALKRDLAVTPDLQTEALYRDILTDQPTTGPAPAAAAAAEPDRPSIAVLPFRNLSDAPTLGHLCDGIAEDIVTGLGRFRLLFVIDRYSSSAVAQQTEDVAEIGRRLGAAYLVQGSLQKLDDRLRITVRLVNAATRAQVWGEAFDCAMADAPGIPDRLTGPIVSMLQTRVEGSLIERSRHKPKLAAYECLLRGIKHLRGYGPGDNEKAIELFQQAVDLDPDYALALAYRGFAETVLHGYDQTPPEILERARAMVLKAVEMDDAEGRCHWLFGMILGFANDLAGEERALLRAIALNPNDANAIAAHGNSIASQGRYDEAIDRIREAMRLNPYHPEWYWLDLGSIFYVARRYADAIEAYGHRTQPGPWVLARLAASYAQLDRLDEAHAMAAEVLRLQPDFRLSTLRTGGWTGEISRRFIDGMRKAGLPE